MLKTFFDTTEYIGWENLINLRKVPCFFSSKLALWCFSPKDPETLLFPKCVQITSFFQKETTLEKCCGPWKNEVYNMVLDSELHCIIQKQSTESAPPREKTWPENWKIASFCLTLRLVQVFAQKWGAPTSRNPCQKVRVDYFVAKAAQDNFYSNRNGSECMFRGITF